MRTIVNALRVRSSCAGREPVPRPRGGRRTPSVSDLESALALLAEQRGYEDGRLGRNVDDPTLWVMVTRWRDVGSYRRALSQLRREGGRRTPAGPGRSTSRRRTNRSTECSTRRSPGSCVRVDAPLGCFAHRSQRTGRPRTPGRSEELTWRSRPPRPSTTSSPSPSGAASSSPAARSTAAPARPGTTARSASSSRRTSSASGGARWCSRATTSSAWTPRHPAAPDVGGLRPRRDLHRPADRVPVLPQAVPRRPPAGGVRREEGARDPDDVA